MPLELEVNGDRHVVESPSETPLLFVLRNELGLTAAKLGCSKEQCGACVVLVDGDAKYSCVDPVGAFAGKSIRTSEGLQSGTTGQQLREAFIRHSAAQCGYCTPGIFVALNALFRADQKPAEADIRAALQPHLCRCGSQARVLRAAREVAGLS